MPKILFDPNTGARLSAGQSVVSKETGQTLTQGVEFGAPTVQTGGGSGGGGGGAEGFSVIAQNIWFT